MNRFTDLLRVVLVQVAVSSAFAVIDETVRTAIRERVKRNAVLAGTPSTGLGS